MDENKKEKILIGAKEAAALLNVSMPTFYQMAASEGFPSLRAGKKILVSVDGLKEWVNQHYGNNVAP
ncbi:MAG: helix-turn-helix domain-containing protein [Clostridia bacterium]|nr:helix-turn-helix domain-containing protein [Clostridia bacterium]